MSSFFNITRRAIALAGAVFYTAGWLIATPAYATDSVQVIIDEAKILRLAEPVARVIIGNPATADVSVLGSTMLVLTGKSYGKTNMILLNRDGETIANLDVSVDQNPTRTVSIRKGTERYSYHCPAGSYCNPTAELGDVATHFAEVQAGAIGKMGMAKALSNNGGGGKQGGGGNPARGE